MRETTGRVGFIGLGRMGTPMTARLVEGGTEVVAYDSHPDARRRAAELGASSVERLEDLRADVLIMMLPDSGVVEAVVDGMSASGALSEGVLLVDMSSSEPTRTRRLAERLREDGVSIVDAPVSGGVAGAERGSLTIMTGGDPADIERARPFLELLGKVSIAGPVGAGHAVKALNNLMSATNLWIASEAIRAGERFGLDPSVVVGIVSGSSGRSGATQDKWPDFVIPETYDSGFSLSLMLKDMRIAAALTEATGTFGELTAHAVALWARADADLGPGADHTEVARWLVAAESIAREGAPIR